MKKIYQLSIVTLAAALTFASCKKEDAYPGKDNPTLTLAERIAEGGQNPDELDLINKTAGNTKNGYMYTESNSGGTNRILIYRKGTDGGLTYQGSVASGGAGNDSLFGSQGAVKLDYDHKRLYAVNTASNSVSSFNVGADGNLTLAYTVASGGVKPVSITVYHNFLYVANQISATINGYTIGSDGSLTPIPNSNLPLSSPAASPGQIAFHPNGNQLYITERATNTITSFQVSGQGVAYNRTTSASAGVTPFGFDFARNHMVVTHAHMDIPNLGGVGSYTLNNNGTVKAVNGNVASQQTAACWAVTTAGGRFAFIANSFSDDISSYYIGKNGAAYLINGNAAPTDKQPRDLVLLDNYSLYVLNVNAHTISGYYRGPLGTLQPNGHVTGLPAYAAGLAGFESNLN